MPIPGSGLIENYTYCLTTYIILDANTFIDVSTNKDTGQIEAHINKGLYWLTNTMKYTIKSKPIRYSQELLSFT
jgi:hypothetical protein